MTVINLEARLKRIEAARHRADPALKVMTDDDLVRALREASDNPADHALAAWFQGGCLGPLPAAALDALQRSL